jgi:hypothetical protein
MHTLSDEPKDKRSVGPSDYGMIELHSASGGTILTFSAAMIENIFFLRGRWGFEGIAPGADTPSTHEIDATQITLPSGVQFFVLESAQEILQLAEDLD